MLSKRAAAHSQNWVLAFALCAPARLKHKAALNLNARARKDKASGAGDPQRQLNSSRGAAQRRAAPSSARSLLPGSRCRSLHHALPHPAQRRPPHLVPHTALMRRSALRHGSRARGRSHLRRTAAREAPFLRRPLSLRLQWTEHIPSTLPPPSRTCACRSTSAGATSAVEALGKATRWWNCAVVQSIAATPPPACPAPMLEAGSAAPPPPPPARPCPADEGAPPASGNGRPSAAVGSAGSRARLGNAGGAAHGTPAPPGGGDGGAAAAWCGAAAGAGEAGWVGAVMLSGPPWVGSEATLAAAATSGAGGRVVVAGGGGASMSMDASCALKPLSRGLGAG